MFGLDPTLTALLCVCIFFACAFEFVNGFHDTANAVATVIYTNTLKPITAVIWSGCWNFLGVVRGGIDVAMGIVILLPLEHLASQSPMFSVAMVMALLISAIIWNLGTWYLGIPCSSSHTLIGAIIGVGLAFQFMPQNTTGAIVNWSKAGDIGLSLLFSPLIGMGVTIILMFLAMKLIKNEKIFTEPEKDKKPPLWIRLILIGTCTGVSYAHGNNDGQKGVGLVMVILIALVPMQFVLDLNQDIRKSAIDFNDLQSITAKVDTSQLDEKSAEKFSKVKANIASAKEIASSVGSVNELSSVDKLKLRSKISKISKDLGKLVKEDKLPLVSDDKKHIKQDIESIQKLTDYAPFWVILLISISLGFGTMIGWKRIVVTIGEKIGKSHLTYAQGASAELVAAGTIYTASTYGLPVSTTQVLTSAVAGSMVAKEGFKNLQPSTLKSIAIAWILTLPVCIALGGGLFWLLSKILM
jgi:PiT family inorganic phosphate transporter